MSEKKPGESGTPEQKGQPKAVAPPEYGLDARNFVLFWETAEDADEAHRAMAQFCRDGGHPPIPKPVMIARAAKYRAAGGQLRKFRPGVRPASVGVADMNAYIAEIRRRMQGGTAPIPSAPEPAKPDDDKAELRAAVREMLAKLKGKKPPGESVK